MELAKDIQGEIKTFVIGAIVAITDKFMNEDYKRKLLEVLKMTQIEQWIREEGRLEGIKEGELKGRLETARQPRGRFSWQEHEQPRGCFSR